MRIASPICGLWAVHNEGGDVNCILALALLFTVYLPWIRSPGPVFSPFAVEVSVLRVVSHGLAPIPEPRAEVRVYTTAVNGALIYGGRTDEQGQMNATPSTPLPYRLYVTVRGPVPYVRSNEVLVGPGETLRCLATGAGEEWGVTCVGD
jgi:hypothetical protein